MAVSAASNPAHFAFSSAQSLSPIGQMKAFEGGSDLQAFPVVGAGHGRPEPAAVSAIFMRKLPRNTSQEALRSMLLFAKDFLGADFAPSDHPEDKGYLSAVAHFRTSNAAQEARAMLDGKPNTAGEATMIVEILQPSPGGGLVSRRNTLDHALTREQRGSGSSGSSNGPAARQASRYNGTFQSLERMSPPGGASGYANGTNGDLHLPDPAASFHLFSPQPPVGPSHERPRVTGKSVIGEDGVDDETGRLLNDPVAYAKSDMAGGIAPPSRRSTLSQLPARFAGLSIGGGGGMASPPMAALASPRAAAPLQSPTSAFAPAGMAHMGPNATYQLSNQHYLRHNYPPVNPADQNPPCNTLYVGNLPIDTSEDELKAMFSKQRGYKRLCFRTKSNGPMCFVEFEDVSFATKALNELYGHPLHNSVKGGIRLSFSKNPLGVRTGQPGGMGMPSPMTPGPLSGMGAGRMPSFSTANGPPPGLAAPPGLGAGGSATNGGGGAAGPVPSGGFAGPMSPIGGPTSPRLGGAMGSGSNPWSNANGHFEHRYMVGR
jgi:hypothetical protein